MPYCYECGAEIESAHRFCPECGEQMTGSSETQVDESEAGSEPPAGEPTDAEEGFVEKVKPTSSKTAISGVVFGLIIGFLFAWGLAETDAVGVGFMVGFIGGMLYIWTRPTTHHSVASGLYISGLVLVFVPLMFYTPVITGADPDTLEGAGEQIGGILGLFIWTILFAIFAAVIGLVGRSIKKRAPEGN